MLLMKTRTLMHTWRMWPCWPPVRRGLRGGSPCATRMPTCASVCGSLRAWIWTTRPAQLRAPALSPMPLQGIQAPRGTGCVARNIEPSREGSPLRSSFLRSATPLAAIGRACAACTPLPDSLRRGTRRGQRASTMRSCHLRCSIVPVLRSRGSLRGATTLRLLSLLRHCCAAAEFARGGLCQRRVS